MLIEPSHSLLANATCRGTRLVVALLRGATQVGQLVNLADNEAEIFLGLVASVICGF